MLERLRSDNFTPRTRTPWGGQKIIQRYKRHLDLSATTTVVGESWEISVEPSFPSQLERTGETLSEIIQRAPEDWLGSAISRRYAGQTPLLVKLLDTAEHLSVQVHPAHDDPQLAPGESGKPEAWLIVDREPGAGIYLGFQKGVTRAIVEKCIRGGGALDALMNFVEVERGDCFEIEAGTPHCIGAGVTLIEPQLVWPGKRGVTYRFWDWNRHFDAQGNLSPQGSPRPLHLKRSLAVTRWDVSGGDAFVESCRREGRRVGCDQSALVRRRWIDDEHLIVETFEGSGEQTLTAPETMTTFTCIQGHVEVTAERGHGQIQAGESAVLPAAAGGYRVTGRDAQWVSCRSGSK